MAAARRRWPRRVGLAVLLVAVAGAAVLARARLAEWAVAAWAVSNGLPEPRLSVAALDLHRVVVTDAAVGAAASAKRVEVHYDLSPLWRPRLLRVDVDGAVVDVDAAAALADALRTGGGGTGADAAIPAVAINDAVLRMATPRGDLELALDGTASPTAESGKVAVDFRFAARGRLGELSGRLTGSGTATSGGRGTLAARLSKDGTARGRVEADVALAGATLTLEATVSAADRALEGKLTVSARDVFATPVAAVDAALSVDAAAPMWRELDLGLRRGRLEARVKGAGLRPTGDGDLGAVEVGLSAADLAAEAAGATRATLILPLRLRRQGDSYLAVLDSPGEASASGIVAGPVRQTAPATVAIATADAPLLRVGDDGGVAAAAVLTPGAIAVAIGRDGAPPLPVRVVLGSLRLARHADGRLVAAAEGGGVSVPDYGIAAAGIAVALDTGSLPARLSVGALTLGEGHTPLKASASVGRKDARLTGEAEVTHVQHGRIASVAGGYDPASDRGQAKVAVGPLQFRPGGLQPGDLAAVLDGVSGVRGAAEGEFDLRWAGGSLDGKARLRLDDVAIADGPVPVEGLAADLRLDSLSPPRTPPGQAISARSIGGEAGLQDARMTFDVGPTPDGDLRVAFAGGGGNFAGGRVTVQPGELVAGAPSNTVTFGFERVGIAPLFALLDVDGVDGSGFASGSIPVTFSDSSVSIRGGRLTAEPDGVIRIKSEAVNRALSGGGEPVRLMLQALEDFRYERLSLDIDKAADGEARLLLSTLGHNPAVLEGHPFALNITLSTNADRLLAAILEAYSVSDRALESLLGRRP
ncbi:MAG: YdbH domain-containing protein [Rhodospirillaceae bacterium]